MLWFSKLEICFLHFFLGPFFLVSALMINVLKDRPFNNGHLILGTFVKDDFSVPTFYLSYNRSLSMVASTTFLTGIIQVGLARAQLARKNNAATGSFCTRLLGELDCRGEKTRAQN